MSSPYGTERVVIRIEPTRQHRQTVEVEAATRQGQGPCNEDSWIVCPENRLFAVIDGVSGMDAYTDSEGRTSGALAALTLTSGIQSEVRASASIEPLARLQRGTLSANEQLRQFMIAHNVPFQQPEHRWGAAHVAVIFDEHVAHWVQTGDCMLYARYTSGAIRAVTHDAVEPFDAAALRVWQQDEAAWHRHERPEAVSDMLLANRRQANRPHGYSVMNGDPQLHQMLESGSLPLSGLSHLIMISDGLYEWREHDTPPSVSWLEQLIEDGVQRYAERLQQYEDNDAYCNQVPRFKKSDDKTGIIISF
ncbi:protein phosphatase 2C domain-containing protein [Paenibacillus sp. 481]|uniref:protein phosphatase 2C domain-containing protein n=1 Tax=Paenibacillus sp. 481 TaxID=2835869 RepID=UPI001E4E2C6F|nr:protein phosphatase 2C domain-containing protein [Paenibacillus sp. 481]UHA72813.1 protein phosphatase 2C domain-containing protein [Paenibacillus sp. 481]